jgi:hemerythrin
MITWTEEFQTGSPVLDRQHRLLIDNINLLGDQLRNPNRTKEELEFAIHLVDYLEEYANIHFKAEERCMESYRCPVQTQNLQEHERFREFIRAYKSRCEAEGFRVELLSNLHAAIRRWIEEHILKIDTQLRRCISLSEPKGSGSAPE